MNTEKKLIPRERVCLIASGAEIWKTYDIDMDEWEDEKDDA